MNMVLNIKKEIPKNEIYKAVIVTVAHNEFKLLSEKDWNNIIDKSSVIIDIKIFYLMK